MQVSRLRSTAPFPGVERMDAFFGGRAFAPHRHDTYAVGVTTRGVQAFDYRGASHASRVGQAFVLHPDERHDGRAGDARGFGYRIAYIDPALIGAGAAPLPFIRDPVGAAGALRGAIRAVLNAEDEAAMTEALAALADALAAAAGPVPAAGRIDRVAMRRVRAALLAAPAARIGLPALERMAGLSRWDIARQFRRAYGVGPARFQLLRRLDHARAALARGEPLAEVALAAGFADQAHLTRQFRAAYGLPPGRWRALSVGYGAVSPPPWPRR